MPTEKCQLNVGLSINDDDKIKGLLLLQLNADLDITLGEMEGELEHALENESINQKR